MAAESPLPAWPREHTPPAGTVLQGGTELRKGKGEETGTALQGQQPCPPGFRPAHSGEHAAREGQSSAVTSDLRTLGTEAGYFASAETGRTEPRTDTQTAVSGKQRQMRPKSLVWFLEFTVRAVPVTPDPVTAEGDTAGSQGAFKSAGSSEVERVLSSRDPGGDASPHRPESLHKRKAAQLRICAWRNGQCPLEVTLRCQSRPRWGSCASVHRCERPPLRASTAPPVSLCPGSSTGAVGGSEVELFSAQDQWHPWELVAGGGACRLHLPLPSQTLAVRLGKRPSELCSPRQRTAHPWAPPWALLSCPQRPGHSEAAAGEGSPAPRDGYPWTWAEGQEGPPEPAGRPSG
ncbi:uncharacterized protein LOC116574568 [Mustela erminea]|uniref:uncharacterized protein LOC116574568 n=1 Tax=Mustela erminea TaxID=36723 RepID=UPI001386927D|nr:uncharacterized protein LOC116574568 [Mustela erminea]